MTMSEFEIRRIEKAVDAFMEKRRPPPDIRKEVDLGFRIKGQSIELFEVRPAWRDPGRYLEEAIAKATYIKVKQAWRVYWQRADLKWHSYEPCPQVKSIEEFLSLVDREEYRCFFG
jgi:hypothetical protein